MYSQKQVKENTTKEMYKSSSLLVKKFYFDQLSAPKIESPPPPPHTPGIFPRADQFATVIRGLPCIMCRL